MLSTTIQSLQQTIQKEIQVLESLYNTLNNAVTYNSANYIENGLNELLNNNELTYEVRAEISKRLSHIQLYWTTLPNLQTVDVINQVQTLHHFINIFKHIKNDSITKEHYTFKDIDVLFNKLENFKNKQPFSMSMETALLSAKSKAYELIAQNSPLS